MRVTKLVRTAIDAELVLAKSSGRRVARQAVLLVVGALLGLFALALLHTAAYLELEQGAGIAPVWSALIVAGVDLLFCLIVLVLARSGGPDARAIEARMVRDRALSDLRGSFAIAALSGPAGRLAGRGLLGAVRRAAGRRKR